MKFIFFQLNEIIDIIVLTLYAILNLSVFLFRDGLFFQKKKESGNRI